MGLLVVAALIVAGAVFWYVRSLPAPVRIQAAVVRPGQAAGAPSVPSPSPGVVVVHVAGWVKRPGVYELHAGQRVVDAVDRAGGARRGADLSSLNLAALLSDGQQVLIGKAGAAASVGGTAASGVGSSASGDKVNLNSATPDQLEELPGIGEVLAQRIIDYREEHGPFVAVEDLLNVSGIGEARMADLASMVSV